VVKSVIEPVEDLIKGYYAANQVPLRNFKTVGAPVKPFEGSLSGDPGRAIVYLTGGKDSVHLAVRLKEKLGAVNVKAVYVAGLNRSETFYERRTVPIICSKIGIDVDIYECSNGIKLNRTGHNIGLREQLVIALSWPTIVNFNAGSLYFGLTHDESLIPSMLWTDTPEAFESMEEFGRYYGQQFKIKRHLDYPGITEELIMRDMIVQYPHLLKHVESCYTQMNWRENMHKMLANSCGLEIYKGCGYCVKCCRINASMMLYDARIFLAPIAKRKILLQHILKMITEKFSDDSFLVETIKKVRIGMDSN
jgi:hypothetical protein